MLAVMAGLPASGKSTIAVQLSARLGAVLLSKDKVRATLFPSELIEYSSSQDDFCIEIILQAAGYILERNPSSIIIIDGRTFSKRSQIQRIEAAAEHFHTKLKIIECVCTDETAQRRIAQDKGKHLAANRNFDLYLRLKADSDPIELPKLILNTDRAGLEENVRAAERYLISADSISNRPACQPKSMK
ncbi:MAG: ATP-binding protein [Chthoniobacterales bacterium]|jgi:predicted kinase